MDSENSAQPQPRTIDVEAFARTATQLTGEDTLGRYNRLAQDLIGVEVDFLSKSIHWSARGECYETVDALSTSWLHLTVQAKIPQICQRCLTPVATEIAIDRRFRFTSNEAAAAALDEELQEDVLVASHQFDLHELIEDELLLALPIVPAHTLCPIAIPMQVMDADFEMASAKPNPFAVLAKINQKKSRF